MKNNLSKKLEVKPAKKAVTYQLIGAGEKDLLTGRPSFKSGANLPGSTTIYDPDAEDGNYNKVLRYITGEYADAEGKVHYTVGDIDFDHTNSITVRPENFALYEFMERHPANASNPFRDQTKPAIFERVDHEAAAQKLIEADDKLFEAMSLARSMDIDTLVAYARSLGVNVNREAAEIRHDMNQKAKNDPIRFVAEAGSRTTKLRTRLVMAQEEGIIEWNPATRSYMFRNGQEPFHQVAPGMNQIESLTDYVNTSKDGELVLAEIERRLGVSAPIPKATDALLVNIPAMATQAVSTEKAVPAAKKEATAKAKKVKEEKPKVVKNKISLPKAAAPAPVEPAPEATPEA